MGLTLALNRGRILDECLPLLARAGVVPAEDVKSSRKLLFESVEGGHRILIVRGSDVPVYVAHGAADVGITGKDTLLEQALDDAFYEPLDLGIARCTLMVAAPDRENVIHRQPDRATPNGVLRVATKFVNVATRYYESLGQPVEVIKLSGAMEIAPFMGLADQIVDIVDTGNTLRANGLKPVATIADVSTRLIVNKAAMKTKFADVQSLMERMRVAIAANSDRER